MLRGFYIMIELMDYQQAVDYILSFADLERSPGQAFAARNFDLRRVRSLLARLGHPDRGRHTVHIAGSKGKGSTAAIIAAVLQAADYRTGLYTSPHLHSFCERIAVDAKPIPEADVARLTAYLKPHVEAENAQARYGKLTTFELLTTLALLYFRERNAQWQVLEVGMGGRLDATNVVEEKEACVITALGLEHTEVLGDTVEQIAAEKAAIIRPGVPVVLGPQQYSEAAAVVRDKAQQAGAPVVDVASLYRWQLISHDLQGQSFRLEGLRWSQELWIPLLGEHQLENAATAVAALDLIVDKGYPISKESVAAGLAAVCWPGRLEVLRQHPLVVADGAHSADAARRLRSAIQHYFPAQRVITVIGLSADKDALAMASELAPLSAQVMVTRSRHPRAADVGTVTRAFSEAGATAEERATVAEAVKAALTEAGAGDLVCITGSLFVVAEAREYLRQLAANPNSR